MDVDMDMDSEDPEPAPRPTTPPNNTRSESESDPEEESLFTPRRSRRPRPMLLPQPGPRPAPQAFPSNDDAPSPDPVDDDLAAEMEELTFCPPPPGAPNLTLADLNPDTEPGGGNPPYIIPARHRDGRGVLWWAVYGPRDGWYSFNDIRREVGDHVYLEGRDDMALQLRRHQNNRLRAVPVGTWNPDDPRQRAIVDRFEHPRLALLPRVINDRFLDAWGGRPRPQRVRIPGFIPRGNNDTRGQ